MSALPVSEPRQRFLDAAWSIGARLCRDAIWDGARCNWLGDSMELHGGEWKVAHKSFGPDLYSGTSGIALFLARLDALRPDPLVAKTARGAIGQALSRAGDIPPRHRHALYSGWLGLAIAAYAFDDLKNEAFRLIDEQLGHDLEPMSLDVISGAAGAILGLLAFGDRYLDEARRMGEHLLAHA
ncbi:MAG TPA: lanthionine synthetase LanC family protein, partial [Thermoanaerobaculia bacterium]